MLIYAPLHEPEGALSFNETWRFSPMSLTFMNLPKYLFTSESVTEGHPDKICDQVSDAVLDALYKEDPYSRVACECATKTGFIMAMGEITTTAFVNFDELVRKIVNDIGYDSSEKGFDGNTCGVMVALANQSPDIALGVDKAKEAKEGQMNEEDEMESIGAGDQGMMFGYACNETDVLMPMPIYYAHKLTRRLAEARRANDLDFLRPDGKSQVTVEYEYGKPKRIHTVLISTQHSPDVTQAQIREGVIEEIIKPVLPPELVDDDMIIYVNPTGRFVVGGPMGDAGVTGRKIVVDTYGTRRRLTVPAHTLPAGWRRMLLQAAWRIAVKCRWLMPSAWRGPSPSMWRPLARGRLRMLGLLN